MLGKGVTANLLAALAFAGSSVAAITATPVLAAEAQMKIANVVPAAAPRSRGGDLVAWVAVGGLLVAGVIGRGWSKQR